jgi:hypothetical protein
MVYPAFHGRYVVRYTQVNGHAETQVEVLTLETGKWSAPFDVGDSGYDIWPAGSHLFYRDGGSRPSGALKAVDMTTGKVTWERQVGRLPR